MKIFNVFANILLLAIAEPRQGHSTEICADNLLIVGGRTANRLKDSLSSVVLYDIKKNECKQLAPLLYEVNYMATVRWGDNIVVIGAPDPSFFKSSCTGQDKKYATLNTSDTTITTMQSATKT
jgi:hypothetical protein